MKKYILFTILLMTTYWVNAQNLSSPGFIRQTEPFEFCFPQFEVGLSLPAKSGFMASVFSGKEVMMNIDTKTIYCCSLDYLDNDKTNFFRFSLSDDKSYMQLRISKLAKFDEVKILENARHRKGFVEVMKSIKSRLGESVSYKLKTGDNFYEEHLFYKDGYLFTFSVKSNSSERFAYLKIIAGFGEKNLLQEKVAYENRVKYGYYDKEKNKPTVKPDEGGFKYRKIAGKLQKNTIIDIPNMHMSINVPAGFVYELNGRKLVEDDKGGLVLEIEEIDLINNGMILGWLRGNSLSLILRYSSKKHRSPVSFNNLASGAKQVYSFSGDTKLFIDGLEMDASYYGSPDIQNIDTWVETENGFYSFSASNITTTNIDIYDRLFTGIKVDTEKLRNKKALTNQKQLSVALDVKERTPIKLDKLNFPKQVDIETFKCNFSTVGAILQLPGKPVDYKYGIMRTFGEEKLILDAAASTPIAPDYENMFVCLYSHGKKYRIDCTLYLQYGDKTSIEDMLKDGVRSRSSVRYQNKIVRAGLIKAVDGSEWGFLFEEGNTNAWVYGRNNEYLIMLTLGATNQDDLMKLCSTFYEASFRDVESLQ